MVNRTEAFKAWRTSALITCAIIAVVVLYALVVEAVSRHTGLRYPLSGGAAAAARYALYLLGAAAAASVKFAGRLIGERVRSAPGGSELKALSARSVSAAVLCELPALAGFLIFFLTGGYWDFYLLAVFSLALEFYYFPRRADWDSAAAGL